MPDFLTKANILKFGLVMPSLKVKMPEMPQELEMSTKRLTLTSRLKSIRSDISWPPQRSPTPLKRQRKREVSMLPKMHPRE